MRKIILYIASSIDGFIARDDGRVDWLDAETELDSDVCFNTFIQSVDTILLGRKSYEQALTFGPWPHTDHQTFVFSTSKVEPKTPNTKVIHKLSNDFIKDLKEQQGKDIWLFGGGGLNHSFLQKDLIDEIQLFIQPTALGSGIGIFGNKPVDLKHFSRTESRQLPGGFTLIRCQK